MRSDIVVVGSLNADLVTRIERFPGPGETVAGRDFQVHPGGKGANQAVAAARLRGRVHMVGRTGRDAHGDLLIESLRRSGVDVEPVVRDESAPTGLALITIDASGENQIVIVSGANGRLDPGDVRANEALIASAAVVMLQLEVPLPTVEAAARIARQGGATVILDPAPARVLGPGILENVDYLTPNRTELAVLTRRATAEGIEAAARELSQGGRRRVVVKLGAEGALFVDGESRTSWPAMAVERVDTTGAGDAFNAGLAVALAEGRPLGEAARLAAAAGALCVTRAGAQPSMPTREEVEAALSR
jgi:ribokinase